MTSKPFVMLPALGVLALLGACSERAPTRPVETARAGPPSSTRSSSTVASPAPPPSAPSPKASAAQPSLDGQTADGGASVAAAEQPALLGSDGKPLPQTDEKPHVESPAFVERMRHLVSAIRAGDPEAARAAFFPVVAYEQVKDIAQPARDWQARLYTAFGRAIHEYHRSLGESALTIEFVGVEVPDATVRWMKPGSEGNRVGYHRVLRSRLRVKDAAGRERAFEITSMISWRGEWYVVHLHGFK